jgi:L-threonylcarbamoyladenylate synthase
VSEVFEVHPEQPTTSPAALAAAARALAQGSLVVLPTETVYGIACRPDEPSATGRVFAAKRRPPGLSLPLLVAHAEAAWELGVSDVRATRLAAAFWPGPLTMVLPRSERSRPWELGERRDSIALRVPDLPLASSLLRRVGPMAATSANLSGQPPLSDRDELVATFGHAVAVYLVLVPGVAPPHGNPSTVVDLTGEEMRVLRPGPLTAERIRATAARR